LSRSKYPPLQLEQIKSIIIDSQVRRLTDIETLTRLRELGIDISIATVKNYKAQIKSQTQTWIGKLAKSRRGEYVSQYRERIIEVESVQRKLWEIISSSSTGSRSQIEACAKLLDCTEILTQLYDVLPVINAIRVYGCGYDHSSNNKDLPQQDHSPTTTTTTTATADDSNIDPRFA